MQKIQCIGCMPFRGAKVGGEGSLQQEGRTCERATRGKVAGEQTIRNAVVLRKHIREYAGR